MCISCRCTPILNCLGNLSYIFEKLTSWCAMTAVVSCIVTTLIFMLAVGVGLGYNYCYVDFTSGRKGSVDAFDENEKLMIMPANDTESDNKTEFDNSTEKSSRKSFQPYRLPIQKHVKLYHVPLNAGVDFSQLLKEIRSSRQNVTLQLFV